MAEVFVSPGVYVRERDFSYYVSSVGNSSLALIGETKQGPAFLPVLVKNMAEFREKFGNMDPNKLVGYCAKSYFKYANSAYIVRVLGGDALRPSGTEIISIIGNDGANQVVLATLLSDLGTGTVNIATGTGVAAYSSTSSSIPFTAVGAYSGTINLYDANAADYVATIFPRTTEVGVAGNKLALQQIFPTTIARDLVITGNGIGTIAGAWGGQDVVVDTDACMYVSGYSNASTPVIVANTTDAVNAANGLFTINTISDGEAANAQIKIGIENINATNATFDVVVRAYADTNAAPQVLETFPRCTMDPTSDYYIEKQIGDSRDETGDYKLVSNYIYVTVESGDHTGLVPYGFGQIYTPEESMSGFGLVANFPEWSITSGYVSTTSLKRQWPGINYTSTDPDQLMVGHASAWDVTGTDGHLIKGFHLNSGASTSLYHVGQSGTSSYNTATWPAKFLIPVLGGRDGWVYSATSRDLLTNDSTATEQVQWKAAIDLVRNPDEYDINLLAVPGVDLQDSIGTYARELAEERADCLYVGDFPSGQTTAAGAANVSMPDSNYACTYWPYVKYYDSDNTRDVWIPPTPMALEAMAYTDSASFPWYAPAGLNRGLLTDVIRAKYRLTAADRETLYDAKINPIATFPGQGIVIWGQKTLQTRTTALDRINVRRMMLYIEKVIAGASKYLVFEQNDVNTWNRFKNMVQPVMDLVKINRGLYDFRVIMDETTNTPDMIDRNQMVGQIYVKPTKTAEAILINFNILAAGATFDEG